jgi:hypothetical protein
VTLFRLDDESFRGALHGLVVGASATKINVCLGGRIDLAASVSFRSCKSRWFDGVPSDRSGSCYACCIVHVSDTIVALRRRALVGHEWSVIASSKT